MNLEAYIKNSSFRLSEVERAISVFDFASGSQSDYRKLNLEYQKLKNLVSAWDEMCKAKADLQGNEELLHETDDADFKEVIKGDMEALNEKIRKLDGDIKALILPMHPNEGKDVIMEIRPAAGGDEAALFAGDLYRMYQRFCEIQGWKTELMDLSDTQLGGIKSVSFKVIGDGAWSYLHFESGVHRVQRIPVTEAQGRVHTSTATVAVMAEAEEVDFQLNPEELRIDVFRASGHGGQCVNTTDSAVRVTHIPTGMFVASQQEKSQHRNKEIAMTILRSRLLEIKQREEDEKNAGERRSQVGTGDRSERIRTYNFPQNRVTDHRFEITLYDLTNIMEGNLNDLLGEIRAIDADRRFTEMLMNE
ncbi:MAG: peptide chain release factor 1 [Victivallales bacterium]|nr:peptide chain release factor 1 [Victivallales bacterium]